jgi:hypothetical protein
MTLLIGAQLKKSKTCGEQLEKFREPNIPIEFCVIEPPCIARRFSAELPSNRLDLMYPVGRKKNEENTNDADFFPIAS